MTVKLPFDPCALALYGSTGSGKSSQLARLARYIFKTCGLKTRWYLIDQGDTPADVDAGVAEGYIEIVDVRGVPHPYLGAMKLAKGMKPILTGREDAKGVPTGAWQPASLAGFGLVVFDSGSELADQMFIDLSEKAAAGINVGGEGAMNFSDGSETWGKVTIGSSNKAHYNVVQTRMKDFIGKLGTLARTSNCLVACTFSEDRGESETTKMSFIGPKTKGSAQTTLIPGWFKFCYRIVTLPSQANKDPKHVLYTDRHRDGGVEALTNRRFPVLNESVPEEKKILEMYPPMLDPADLVKALQAYKDVTEKVRKG